MLAEFEQATHTPLLVQEDKLFSILERNADCDYGKRYGFAKQSDIAAFQRNVPVVTDDDIRADVARMARGEADVLVSDPVLHFGETSGTTGGSKLIPFTAVHLKVVARHLKLWSKLFGLNFPGVAAENVFSMINRSPTTFTESGVACSSLVNILSHGDDDDRPNRWLPPECFAITDSNVRYYVVLLYTLRAPIRCMVAINPSTLVILCRKLNEFAELLIRDIRDGALTESIPLDPELRLSLEADLVPDPDLAHRLDGLMTTHGELRPVDVWPDLSGLSCWKGGSVGFFVRQFPRWFGDLPVFELGYMATEGMFTLPFSTEGAGGVLSIQSHFFEFVPVAVRDAAPNDPSPRALLAHEIEPGESYYMLLTADNGLYRYDINDVVQVVGKRNATPELQFLHKGRRMLSITGEKMGEAHIAEAVGRAADEMGLFLHGISVAVRMDSIPRYLFAIEPAEFLSDGVGLSFLAACDRHLQQVNNEYEFHRERGALGCPILVLLAPGAYIAYRERQVARGAAESQVKPPCIFATEEALRQNLPFIKEFA